jgi:predicted ATPase
MPIQGREGELEQSRVLVGDVLKGHGRSLVISGESGMGKSRLIDEIVSESLESGIQVLEGACLSYGRTMTYHPWAELLRALFGFDPDHDPARRITLLTNHMQTIGEDLFAPLIGQVLGLPIEDNDLTRDLDAKLRRQRVLDLILKLLQTRAKDQPLLVLIEDVHWADEVSLDLISYIARNIGNSAILFLLSHRPDEDLPDWSALPNTLKLALEGLSAEACLALVRGMLKDQPLSERFGEFILEKAGGNPLFLGEVIRNLLDAGTIFQDREGIWDLPEGVDTVELPDTIHGMIISRMDRLDSADRRMLQIASVVGRTFSTPTLIGVYDFGLEASELDQRIGVMASKGLVELMGADQFRFTHLTTQEVVYESLSYELKRDLHRRIGTHYEETHIGSLNEWIDLLAYHYFEGQAWPKAADYTLRAGRRAQREYANQAAVTACTKTLTAAEKLDVDEQILYTLPAYEVMGEVNSLTGEYDQAIDNFTSALTLVEESKPDIDQIISRADFHRKIAEVYERRSEFDIAFDWLGRSLTLLTKSRPTIVAAQARMLGAGIYRRLGKLDEAVQWCQESLEIAKGIETREGARTVAHANYSMSGIYWRLGDLEKALALASESLRIYTENDDIIGQARAFTNLSNAYADLGDWNRAMQALEKSLEINQRIGNIVSIGFVTNNMATIHLDRGEWDRAYELYQASREIWVKLGASMQEGIILSNLAQVHIYQGNWPEAESSLIESKHIFETLGSEDYLPELERRWAELYLQTDNLEAACAHAHQALEMASALEARLDLGTAFRVLGEIYLAQNNLEEAEMSLRRSARILQDLESEYEAAKVTLPLAALAKAKGEAPDIVALQAARATFERLGAQFDLGRTEDILKRI